jgi:hypothetical protein
LASVCQTAPDETTPQPQASARGNINDIPAPAPHPPPSPSVSAGAESPEMPSDQHPTSKIQHPSSDRPIL